MDNKKDPHEKQWLDLEHRNMSLSTEKGDIYYRRAESCRRLLDRFC